MGIKMAQLLSVNVGLPRDIQWKGKRVYTAVWKDAGRGGRKVGRLNIDGDGQGDLQGHGGEHRAVLVYQIDSYRIGKGSSGEATSCLDNSARTSRWRDCRTMRSASATVIASA